MTAHEFPPEIAELARRRSAAVFATIERACEAAIQGGICGVMIDGDRAWVDPRVPYGQKWDATACGADNVDA